MADSLRTTLLGFAYAHHRPRCFDLNALVPPQLVVYNNSPQQLSIQISLIPYHSAYSTCGTHLSEIMYSSTHVHTYVCMYVCMLHSSLNLVACTFLHGKYNEHCILKCVAMSWYCELVWLHDASEHCILFSFISPPAPPHL